MRLLNQEHHHGSIIMLTRNSGQEVFFISIPVQAVCDPQVKLFIYFFHFSGSVHDSRVLKHSPLYCSGLYSPADSLQLGSGRYEHHIVFNSFGIMKTQWLYFILVSLEMHSANRDSSQYTCTYASVHSTLLPWPSTLPCVALLHSFFLSIQYIQYRHYTVIGMSAFTICAHSMYHALV